MTLGQCFTAYTYMLSNIFAMVTTKYLALAGASSITDHLRAEQRPYLESFKYDANCNGQRQLAPKQGDTTRPHYPFDFAYYLEVSSFCTSQSLKFTTSSPSLLPQWMSVPPQDSITCHGPRCENLYNTFHGYSQCIASWRPNV